MNQILRLHLDGEENLNGSGGGRRELERGGERQKYGIYPCMLY